MKLQEPAAWPAVSRLIWESRHRFGDEPSIATTWHRVATAVAAVEHSHREEWARRFLSLMEGFSFLPGGRILAGAGTNRRVTLFNCFVMGTIEDNLPAIFAALTEGALTMQQGGGIGYDFSTIRPQGTLAASSGSIASGPVSFMRIWDAACATMLSTGSRRGAMMATLRCDHPDILAFVNAKRDALALRHFNLSVQVTDEFMQAVRRDADWPLVFPAPALSAAVDSATLNRSWTGTAGPVPCCVLRVVRAVELWEQILHAAYDTAEPGVLFVDQINRENNLHLQERLTAANPCGEIPLPPYGACNLGSLNLTAFVIDPFEPGARLNMEKLCESAAVAVRFLDNVIDISEFPLPAQASAAKRTRRIGLGITGLADALVMLGQRYDGWTARGLAEDVMRQVCLAAYTTSVKLAEERGPFPGYDADEFLHSAFVQRLPVGLRGEIARSGIRNSHLLAIAPAGTISLLAGNVSSGIEPVFSRQAQRKVLGPDGRYATHVVEDLAWRMWQRLFPGQDAPESFVEARQISPQGHLDMQAALQGWVDNAISKTINVATDTSFDDFRQIYELAHQRGLKGCTVFRPNEIRGSVLSPIDLATAGPCCDMEREAD